MRMHLTDGAYSKPMCNLCIQAPRRLMPFLERRLVGQIGQLRHLGPWADCLQVPRARCRDMGGRMDRQKARLMWLVEEVGVEGFRDAISQYMGGAELRREVRDCRGGS